MKMVLGYRRQEKDEKFYSWKDLGVIPGLKNFLEFVDVRPDLTSVFIFLIFCKNRKWS